MKFARYEADGEIGYGVVEGELVRRITLPPFGPYEITDRIHAVAAIKLLPPVAPSKVIGIGLNYASHLGDRPIPDRPGPFWKSPSATIGPDETIILPSEAGKVDAEGELVVVMGREAKRVNKEEALDYVLGYTCGNDVSAREWQANDLQWWRAKGSDTFGPLGPFIVTGLDPSRLELRTRLNGEEKQFSPTSDLIFDVPTIVSFVSRVVTLQPGDVIYTGTPGHAPQLHTGDIVEVEVAEIGVLRNSVIESGD